MFPYASTVKEVETMLEDALDTMDRVHEARQCNSVNVKQVAEVFEAGMQEIFSLKTIMESQRKQTKEALEALAAQREETNKALEQIEAQKKEIAAALQMCTQIQTSEVEDRLKESLLDSCRTESSTWAAGIQDGTTNATNFISCATNPVTSSMVDEHIQSSVLDVYANETKNMDVVLNFVDKLPTPSLALSAYKALLGAMDRTTLKKEAVRLIYKMYTSSVKFNETGESTEPTISNFLNELFPTNLLKLVKGEFFNWVGFTGYVYLYTNPTDANFLDHAARLKNSESSDEDRKEDKWFWQILPVPGRDGKVFYLRNKLNANTPVLATSGVEKNHIRLMPVNPSGRTAGDTTKFNVWSVYTDKYVSGGSASSSTSVGIRLTLGDAWIWGAQYH